MNNFNTTPILSGEQVFELVPQSYPVIMVDKLWDFNEKKTTSGFTVSSSNIFFKDGFFREPGIIENMAQTAALGMGYQTFLSKKEGEDLIPPVGYIGAVKKLKIERLPVDGDELRTEIEVQQTVFDVTLIEARTILNNELIASCEMKIFLKK